MIVARPSVGIGEGNGTSQGLEVFSTILWHLKKEVALCHLAQQTIAVHRSNVFPAQHLRHAVVRHGLWLVGQAHA